MNNSEEESSSSSVVLEIVLDEEIRVSVSSNSSISSNDSLLNNTLSADDVLIRSCVSEVDLDFFFLRRRCRFGEAKTSSYESRRGVGGGMCLGRDGDDLEIWSSSELVEDDLQPQAAVLKAEDTWRLKEKEEWWGFGGGRGDGGSVGTTEVSLLRQQWKEGIRSSLNRFAIIISPLPLSSSPR